MNQTSYPKNKINVLLLENIHKDAVRVYQDELFNVELLKPSLDVKELSRKIKNVHILGMRSKTYVDREVLQHANKLWAIGAYCIGTNNIDLAAAQDNGIAVFNAPYSNTRSVVELALAEIILLARQAIDKNSKMHQGVWDKSANACHEVRGKKLGIIGYGNIGAQLSVLAEAMGMQVFYYDIVEKLALGNAVKCRTMNELLRKVDIVTLHVDGRKENADLIADAEFKLMKKGTVFLNLSRGFVVDIKALAKHLKNGRIKGAAVDVFPTEPSNNAEPFVSELQGLDNVILTPHIGGSTEEAQCNIAHFVSEHIINYINTGDSLMSVNFPELKLPELVDAHRMIHIHKNTPGVLAHINKLFAAHDINVLGQYLKTNENIGYVITDVSKKYDKGIIDKLKAYEHTIRFRVLY